MMETPRIKLESFTSRHASLRTWRARCQYQGRTTDLFLAVKNVTDAGAAVNGSIWAIRSSEPGPLVAALFAAAGVPTQTLYLQAKAADALPFEGTLVGRFLGRRADAAPGAAGFGPTPPGDWWVATCVTPPGNAFTLAINEIASSALILPGSRQAAEALANQIMGLWKARPPKRPSVRDQPRA